MKQRHIQQRNNRIRQRNMRKVNKYLTWSAHIVLIAVFIAALLYAGGFELQSLLAASGG